MSNPKPKAKKFSLNIHYPQDHDAGAELEKADYTFILKQINRFNLDAKKLTAKLKARIAESKELLPTINKKEPASKHLKTIRDGYALADVLAIHFQTRRHRTLASLFALAMLAFVFFELYAHLWPEPIMLAFYPITLVLLLALFIWAKSRGYQEKHLEYRALAEGLRVQYFWSLVGLRSDITEYYLRKQRSELEWVRTAIRSYSLLTSANDLNDDINKDKELANYRIALKYWVDDQLKYYVKSTSRDHRKMKKQEYRVGALFLLGVILAIVAILADYELVLPHVGKAAHHLLIVAMGLAPAIAAALDSFAEKMVFAAQAKKYQQMHDLFDRASRHLKVLLNNKDAGGARKLIRELGKESLLENSDWVLMHRDRPMKIPIGG